MRRLLLLALGVLLVGAPAAYAISSRAATDAATAKSLLIVKRDMPAGFADDGLSVTSGSCTGASRVTVKPTADAVGHDFKRTTSSDFSEVGTEARLFRSSAAAHSALLQLYKSHPVGMCLAQTLRQAFKGSLANVQIHPYVLRLKDMQMQAFDISGSYRGAKKALPIEMLAAGYLRGRALVMLTAIQGGTTNAKAVGAAAATAIVSKLRHARV